MNKRIILKRSYPLIAAFITAALFIVALTFLDITGYGNYTIMYGDLYAQYMAFIKTFLRALKGESSFWYSFSLYLGSGTALTYAYYCINPFNLLYLIEAVPFPVMTYVIICSKISLAAASFVYFEKKALKNEGFSSVIFAVCYALSTFTAALYIHIMWLDALYILPFLTYLTMRAAGAIKEESKNGSKYPFAALTLSFAYLFITNFYMGFIVGVFEALTFILSFFRNSYNTAADTVKILLRKGLAYAGAVILAAAMCSAFLIPAAWFIYSHAAPDNFEFTQLYATIPDIINSMFIGEMPHLDNDTPFIYCSLAVLLLLPLFFKLKSISKRDKHLIISAFVFYLLSMLILPFYEFMHAFDYPNWYAYRYSFCIIFMMTVLSSLAIRELKEQRIAMISIPVVLYIVLYSFMIPLAANRATPSQITNSSGNFFINSAYLLLYLGLFLLYKKSFSKLRFILPACFVIAVCSELVLNFYLCDLNRAGDAVSELAYRQWHESESDALARIKANDDSFYRISVDNEMVINSPAALNYAGLDTFSSSDDYPLRKALFSLGIVAPNRAIVESGYTPITYMLTGTKYRIKLYDETAPENKDKPPIPDDVIVPAETSRLDYALPLIFMADDDILSYSFTDDPFINQEKLISSLSGHEYTFFSPIDEGDFIISNYNTNIDKRKEITIISKKSTLDSSLYYSFLRPKQDGRTLYAFFQQNGSNAKSDTFWIIAKALGWYETRDIQSSGIVEGSSDVEQALQFIPNADHNIEYEAIGIYTYRENVSKDYCSDILFYDYNEDGTLKKAYDDLIIGGINNAVFNNDTIKGTITVSKDRSIMFTTIPYDEGWHIYCDGQEIEKISTVEGAFLAASLPEGTHEIELKYIAPFAKEGKIISIVAAAIFLICASISFIKKDKNKEKNK